MAVLVWATATLLAIIFEPPWWLLAPLVLATIIGWLPPTLLEKKMTYYDDEPERAEDPAFEAFKKMQQDILQLQKAVGIIQNMLNNAAPRLNGVEGIVAAHTDHLRTISRAMQIRLAPPRPPSAGTQQQPPSPRQPPPPPPPPRREFTRTKEPPAPPPPSHLVDVNIQDAEPTNEPPPERPTKRK